MTLETNTTEQNNVNDELNTGQTGEEGENRTFEFFDPSTKQKINIPEKIGDLDMRQIINGIIAKSRKDAEKKFESIKQAIGEKDATVEELRHQLEQYELEKLPKAERDREIVSRELEQIKKQLSEKEQAANDNWHLFRQHKVDNDIFQALSGYDLCNAGQTAMLIKSFGQAEIVKDDSGQFNTAMKMNVDGIVEEISPREFVQKWLSLPENAHHLKNNLKSGGGTSEVGGLKMADGSIAFSRKDFSDPKKRKEMLEKFRTGEAVSILPD